MNSYIGEIINVDGKGDICRTKISKDVPLPHKGDLVLINGIERTIRDVEISDNAEFGRKEEVGLVLYDLKE